MTVKINYSFSEVAAITGGRIIQQHDASTFSQLLLDSRKLTYPDQTIFITISSQHRKAIDFIAELYEKGVRNFIIDEMIDISGLAFSNILFVENSLAGLQQLATHHRKRFSLPVIGITGSNGKTIVKEWLNQLLSAEFNIVRSPRSFNSQVGVPLSVLQITNEHTLGIFEAGISEPGEMEKLERIIEPTLGVLTNIGDAHDSGFTSREEKLIEKSILFKNAESVIWGLQNHATIYVKVAVEEKQSTGWKIDHRSTLSSIEVNRKESFTEVSALFREQLIKIIIPFTDRASVENAITCWCIALKLNIAQADIAERMTRLFQVEMRLDLKEGINQCSVINDCYSSDIQSLQIALDFLGQQKHIKKTVILSDILQSGRQSEDLYEEVAHLMERKGISRIIGIGQEISSCKHLFNNIPEHLFFQSVDAFTKDFHNFHFSNETILLKGARKFEFENLSSLLEQKVHQTILSIDLSALSYNLNQYRRLLNKGVKVMAMVKAFSYGSGSYEIANLLQFHKVDYLAVAYSDEGVELRRSGINLPILVMNPEESSFNSIVSFDLEPEIFSFFILDRFEKYLESSGVDDYPIHIKLDTGMHRLGFDPVDINILSERLENNKRVKVMSVFSHLIASDDIAMNAITEKQLTTFKECCKYLKEKLAYNFLEHIANSSAIDRREFQLDMVRLGIGLYGLDNHLKIRNRLKNVSTLTTTIAQIKWAKKGETIGYGGKNVLERNSRIAVVRIGYADGYPRVMGNGVGKMLIRNKLIPIIGNVCMDMTMLDITDHDEVTERDPVIVYGALLPVNQLALWANTISYEIITGISQRVKRVYFED